MRRRQIASAAASGYNAHAGPRSVIIWSAWCAAMRYWFVVDLILLILIGLCAPRVLCASCQIVLPARRQDHANRQWRVQGR